MKRALLLGLLLSAPTALAGGREAPATPAIGGQTDAHGCLDGAGQTWSALRGECVQVFNVADLRLNDPYNPTQAVYIIFSADRKRAELFGLGYQSGVLLHKTRTGYTSVRGKVQLTGSGNHWTVKRLK